MNNELEFIKRLKSGLPVAGAKIVERRSKGLLAIRHQFLVRITQAAPGQAESSLAIRWRRLTNFANARTVVDQSFELVMHGGTMEVAGLFPDIWVLCYPEDVEIKKNVEAKLDQMCDDLKKKSSAS